jgi:putative restriction endonuclease
MRLFVGVTDDNWYRQLSADSTVDEVNFWQPSGGVEFKALQPGEPFLFKLHSPRDYIIGGGFYAHWSKLPVSLAWEAFGPRNGAHSLQEMRVRLAKYRKAKEDPREDHVIGCILLEEPFFFPERQWIPVPEGWARNIVRGKGYDTAGEEGGRLWEHVRARLDRRRAVLVDATQGHQRPEARFGEPTIQYPRLGQGSFRVLVTDLYDRRCAVTGERTLPVLEAAHIRPYASDGPHDARNGLLLRSDLHTLLDRGYVTVTPELRFEVSPRIKQEFENGRDYYKLQGSVLRLPTRTELAPAREYLEWHANHVFR